MKIIHRKLSELKPPETNVRIHNEKQISEFKRSVEMFGQIRPVVIDENDIIIAGNGLVETLKALGRRTAECFVVKGLSEKEKKKLMLADNRIFNLGLDDLEAFDKILKDLGDDLDVPGFDKELLKTITIDLGEIDTLAVKNLFFDDEHGDVVRENYLQKQEDHEDDAQIANPKFIPAEMAEDNTEEMIETTIEKPNKIAYSTRGDIFILGGTHRLMCGDATSENDVFKLMNRDKAQLVITDPPYNVDYSGKSEKIISEGLEKIKNDKQDDNQFEMFLTLAFENIYNAMDSGASVYIFHPDSKGLMFRKTFESAGFMTRQCLVWVKNSLVLGRQDYHWRHEPILYGWKDGAAHYFVDDRTQSTVIEEDRPTKNLYHPIMKPLPLMGRLIYNSSKKDWVVLDTFGGSGSTLIACEQLGRKCYTMELDPIFCDVIVKRYMELIRNKGGTPSVELIRNGEHIYNPVIE